MVVRLNWRKISDLRKELSDFFSEEDQFNIVLILKNGSAKKVSVKLSDLLKFCWAISDSKTYKILTFLIQDQQGRILYRHNQNNGGLEEIPNGGNPAIISHWSTLTGEEKDVYVRLMESQISCYEQ